MMWYGMAWNNSEWHDTLLLLLLTVFPCRHRDCHCTTLSSQISLPPPLLFYVTPTPVKNPNPKIILRQPLASPENSNSKNNCQNDEFGLDLFPGRSVVALSICTPPWAGGMARPAPYQLLPFWEAVELQSLKFLPSRHTRVPQTTRGTKAGYLHHTHCEPGDLTGRVQSSLKLSFFVFP